MTETTTPERAALLLADARRFAGIKSATWPPELQPGQLAALFAGGYKGDKKADYEKWRGRIADAIKTGILKARVDQPPDITIERTANGLSPRQSFVKALYPVSDGVRVRMVYMETKTPPPRYFIAPSAAAAWLDAIGEPPGEYVRAWLGDECREEGQGGGKVEAKKASIRAILARIAAIDSEFSPESMPGKKDDFFDLCKKLDRPRFVHVRLATFADYLPGICKFGKGARHSDYYENLAPQMGVKSRKTD